MSIHIDGKRIMAMYWGGLKIREAWYGGERVFSGKPVEVMPPTPGKLDARDWLRAKLTEYGEDYRTVEELPFEIDSSQVTNMSSMFYRCSSLTSVPDMETSKVTNMNSMFNYCSSLTAVPDMDTSQVTNMSSMFNGCSSLTTVPDMHTSNASDVSRMFYSCSSLTDGNVRLIGKHPVVNTYGMIAQSGLTREPFYDSSGRPI